MHRHAGESPAGPQQQTRPTLTGHAFGRYRSSGQGWLPGIGRRQECTAGRGNLDRRGDVVATTSQPASVTPHAWWAPTPAPPIGTPHCAGAGPWVLRASSPEASGKAGRMLNPAHRIRRHGSRPAGRTVPGRIVPGRTVPGRTVRGELPGRRGIRPGGGANLLAAGAPSAATGLRWTGDSAGPTRAIGEHRPTGGSASHGATSTRAGSATAPGGPTTLRRRPGPRAGR
jgi:hypothetical protein